MTNKTKTTGWLTKKHMKVMKVWLWLFENYWSIIETKHDDASIDTAKHTAKMCSAYLKLHKENIPTSIGDKCEAVNKHKISITINSKNERKFKVEPIIRSSHKMIAQLLTSNEKKCGQLQNTHKATPKWIKCHGQVDQEHRKWKQQKTI